MTRPNLWPAAAAALAVLPGRAAAAQPQPWAVGYQAAASPTMQRIVALSSFINVVLVAVVVVVSGLIAWAAWRYNARRNPVPATWSHNTRLEIAWTAIPALILVIIAVPSFRLLYFENRVPDAAMTLKVTGHQWYWSYAYPDQGKVGFDSMAVDDSDLKPGQVRLLSVDNPVVLPVGVTVRIQVTSEDVIHSWSVPAFGVKTDAIPGRLNETWVRIDTPGTYYGQCSQLCGVNHDFMPIMVRAVPRAEFHAWLQDARIRFARTGAGKAVASAH